MLLMDFVPRGRGFRTLRLDRGAMSRAAQVFMCMESRGNVQPAPIARRQMASAASGGANRYR